MIYTFSLTVYSNSGLSFNIFIGAVLDVSAYNAYVEAVIVELIALDLAAIFRCTVISKKGLSWVVTVRQMGTH